MRHNNDFELHVEKVNKRGNQIKIENYEYELPAVDTHKSEIVKKLKNAESKDLRMWFLE